MDVSSIQYQEFIFQNFKKLEKTKHKKPSTQINEQELAKAIREAVQAFLTLTGFGCVVCLIAYVAIYLYEVLF